MIMDRLGRKYSIYIMLSTILIIMCIL
jgi:hypothetical protein